MKVLSIVKKILIISFLFIDAINAYAGFQFQTPPVVNPAKSFNDAFSEGIENQLREQQILQMRQQLAYEQYEQRITQEQQAAENQVKIMIFGQDKHNTYLGCLNCMANMNDSVSNEESIYGNRNYKHSIYNSRGLYGSVHSNYSACNFKGKRPPIIVDNRGNIYGFLTLNMKLHGAVKNLLILNWLTNQVCNTNLTN